MRCHAQGVLNVSSIAERSRGLELIDGNSGLRSRIASVLGCLRTASLPRQKQPGTKARARSVTAGEASRSRKVATKATASARRSVSCTVIALFTCTLDAMQPQSGAVMLFILCYCVC